LLGATLDRKYKLVRLLGEGAMGSVYEALHNRTGRRVAVKLIKSSQLALDADPTSDSASRFRREARAAGALDSPHVVQILDSGEDAATGALYLVMERLEGEDLQHLIDREGRLPPTVALIIAGQALLGLQTAHAAGIVHRDIKPANLFLARRGDGEVTVKLLDFGIAKVRSDPLATSAPTAITRPGGFLGSPLYMSPEQVRDSKEVDHRADVWSLGSALYCALAGAAPHQDIASIGPLILAICSSPATPVEDRAAGISPEIAAVVRRAIALARDDRWPDATAMLEAIRPLVPEGFALREERLVGLGGPGPRPSVPVELTPTQPVAGEHDKLPFETTVEHFTAPPPPPQPRRRVWPWLAGATLAALVIALVIALALALHRTASPATTPLLRAPIAVPSDAQAEVDHVRVPVKDGAIEIGGQMGSAHWVHLIRGNRELLVKVYLTVDGASRADIDFEPAPPSNRGRVPVQ
jgi:serine/threonine-protein kinase